MIFLREEVLEMSRQKVPSWGGRGVPLLVVISLLLQVDKQSLVTADNPKIFEFFTMILFINDIYAMVAFVLSFESS